MQRLHHIISSLCENLLNIILSNLVTRVDASKWMLNDASEWMLNLFIVNMIHCALGMLVQNLNRHSQFEFDDFLQKNDPPHDTSLTNKRKSTDANNAIIICNRSFFFRAFFTIDEISIFAFSAACLISQTLSCAPCSCPLCVLI